MKLTNYSHIALLNLLLILSLTGCEPQPKPANLVEETATKKSIATSTKMPASTQAIDSTAIDTAAGQIDEQEFMQHVRILASDEFEGRAPSTAGGAKTVAYLEKNFADIGLEPAFTDDEGSKSYRQAVKLMELTVTNSPALIIKHADDTQLSLPYKESSIVFTSRTAKQSSIEDSSLVFVGYGIVAPEFGWNDYKNIDMTGKTAVILVNDPGYRKPDGELFKGRAMTYYGRWTYKFEEAARQGAAGAIIVHEDGAAGYPWEVVSGGWSGPQYKLFTENSASDASAVEAWITKSAAQALFSANDLNYEEMVAQATEPGFAPFAMASTATSELQLSSKESLSHNVAGLLPGRVRPDEAFIYTAHWDHLGVKPDNAGDDKIFNGAQDNATGIAALFEMAQAFKALPVQPERSVIFLAVTAEESGLLGSKKYSENPPVTMANTVAGINIDSMSTTGETDDIVVIGYGNSELDDYLRTVSKPMGRELVAEPTPEKGFFYRSDHFNLAKKGVPMLYAKSGTQVRNKPVGYGEQETKRYIKERYHKAADEVHPQWDNGGIMQDMNTHFQIGVQISDSNVWPKWRDGNEFKAIREASQAN